MNIKIFFGRVLSFRNAKTAALALAGIAVFLFAIGYGLSWYGEYSFNKDLQAIKKEAERPYLEDTYGGKTPKETLELFIAAIEKEDFDLASKYFIINKQKEWKEELVDIKNSNKIDEFINPIKEEIIKLSVEKPLWDERETYVSGDSVLFLFVKYPKGIWKLKEI